MTISDEVVEVACREKCGILWPNYTEKNKDEHRRTMRRALEAVAPHLQQSDKFFIGDRVQVVLEGTLMGYNREDGHYYMVGHAGDHVPWLYTLHWSTPFRVLEPGPRDLGDGSATAEEAWEVSQS